MIRFRRLQPDTVRGIRHWAIELAVVVVGVLLALWAAEWAGDRAEAERHDKAMAALDREIGISLGLASRAVMADACVVQQIETLRDLLFSGDEDWPGVSVRWMDEREDEDLVSQVILYPWGNYQTATHERARQTGALEALSDEQHLAYEEVALAMALLKENQEELIELVDEMAPLVRPHRIDEAERADMIRTLARIETLRTSALRRVENLASQARAAGLVFTEDHPHIANYQERADMRTAMGDCLQDIDLATGEGKPWRDD